MHIALNTRPPEIQALIDALTARRGAFPLKARLLKGVRAELHAAHESGLTWFAMWAELRAEGYPGAYQNFCRAASRLVKEYRTQSPKRSEALPPPPGEKEVNPAVVHRDSRTTESKEKPLWQRQREEIMARLDREAEQNREREARLSRPKKFVMTPFVGRSEE